MATVPPVPPRPLESYEQPKDASAPPLPPLPPNFKPELESSPPHFEDTLVAPRPQKLQPDLPANVRHTIFFLFLRPCMRIQTFFSHLPI